MFCCFKSMISNNQHGFFRGRSTLTTIQSDIFSWNWLCEGVRQGQSFWTWGIHSFLLNWLISYLSRKNKVVKLGNYIGVPQGSHFGPLLFLLLFNDLPLQVNFFAHFKQIIINYYDFILSHCWMGPKHWLTSKRKEM